MEDQNCPFCGVDKDHFCYEDHDKSCPFYQLMYNQGVMQDFGNVSNKDRTLAWNTRASVSHAELQKVIDDLQEFYDNYGDSASLSVSIDQLEALLERQTNKEA